MNSYNNLKRLIKVISLISYKARTREEIKDELNRDEYDISDRTFDRIISDIRNGLGFTVEVNSDNTYMIDKNNTENDLEYQVILNLDTLISSKKNLKDIVIGDISKFIIRSEETEGSEKIPLVIDALLKNMKIEIQHKKFESGDISTREVIPIKLIEYEHRWYLLAYNMKDDDLRSFGIDRLINIKQTEAFILTDIPVSIQKEAELFKHRMGVSPSIFKENQNKIFEVVLSVTKLYAPYLRTKKLHSSQTMWKDIKTGKEMIKLEIIPTWDLIKRVVGQLGDIKILGPKVLVDYVKKEYPDISKIITD